MNHPHVFRSRQVMPNKIDLLPHVRFNVDRRTAYAREVNPRIHGPQLPAETAAGMGAWHGWLRRGRARQPRLVSA